LPFSGPFEHERAAAFVFFVDFGPEISRRAAGSKKKMVKNVEDIC